MNQPAGMRSAQAACGLQVEAEAGVEGGGVGEGVAVPVAGQRGAGDESMAIKTRPSCELGSSPTS